MSSPTGLGGHSAEPRLIEKQHPVGQRSTCLLPVENSGQPRFSGMLDSAIASVGGVLGKSTAVQDAFLFTAKEGAEAVYPLEGSVLAGRTYSAYKRDGWMEVQERVFEEAAAAVIWLKGVDWLKSSFKWAQQKTASGSTHLNPDIAWNRPWGKLRSVDLTAQELFTKHNREASKLLQLKSGRWVFSVGLALAGVAYVVPTLNQLKTKAIMSHVMSRRKRSQEGDNVQFGDPVAQRLNHVAQSPDNGFSASNPARFANTAGQLPTNHNGQPNGFGPGPGGSFKTNFTFGGNQAASGLGLSPLSRNVPVKNAKTIQFGALPGGSLIQAMGHMVDQTPYGSILVVDAGIAGGRGYVASKRSTYETIEVLVRDIGSLYFYILSVPHIMKFLGMGADKAFGSSMALEPKVAQQINDQLLKHLPKQGALQLQQIRNVLHGNQHPALSHPESWLREEMRQANRAELVDLLQKEARVYLQNDKGQALIQKIAQGKESIRPQQIQEWLADITAGKGTFKDLTAAERTNLSIALKQAYRHTAGLKVTGLQAGGKLALNAVSLQEHPQFKGPLALLKEEGEHLKARLQRMAQVDGLDQAHSRLRRTINLLRDSARTDHQALFEQADTLADWLDTAKNRGLPLRDLITEELQTLSAQSKGVTLNAHSSLRDLKAAQNKLAASKERSANAAKTQLERLLKLVDGTDASLEKNAQTHVTQVMDRLTALAVGPEKALVDAYQKELKGLMSGEQGRLFSLLIDSNDEGLTHKLKELLHGGLQNDTAFLRKAQMVVSQFTPDSREFADATKAAAMRDSISQYGDALLAKIKDSMPHLTAEGVQKELGQFLNLNRALNYGSRSMALAGTMFCLGWLVPHVQTAITKRLTGKDRNPGIASAASSLGYGKENGEEGDQTSAKGLFSAKKESKAQSPALKTVGSNGIFVGQNPRVYQPALGQNAYQS